MAVSRPLLLRPHVGRTLSGVGVTGLTAACTVLLFLYLAGRFGRHRRERSPRSGLPAGPCRRGRAAPPARRAVPLSLLPVFVHAKDRSDECAVCLSEFGEGEAGRLLPRCGHGFHEACIATWLRLNSTCPLCRAAVASPR